MKHKSVPRGLSIGVFLFVLVTIALAAGDKYTVKVPGGLAFAELGIRSVSGDLHQPE